MDLSKSGRVEILVREHIDAHWVNWFEGYTLVHPVTGGTLITGEIPDQTALFGLLARIRDLNLTLISVQRTYQ